MSKQKFAGALVVLASIVLCAGLWAGQGPLSEIGLLVWAFAAVLSAAIVIVAICIAGKTASARQPVAATQMMQQPAPPPEPELSCDDQADLALYMKLVDEWKKTAVRCGLGVKHADQTVDSSEIRQPVRGGVLSAIVSVGASAISDRMIAQSDNLISDGRAIFEVPVLGDVVKTKIGPQIVVWPAVGQVIDDFRNAAPRLAVALNISEVVVSQNAEDAVAGSVRIALRVRDSLAGIRGSRVAGDPKLRLGRTELGEDAVVDLREASHIGIQGMTRSGKSACCYTLLSQALSLSFVQGFGIDPNRVLLNQVGRFLPNNVALGDDIDKAVRLLDEIYQLMQSRLDSLDSQRIDKLSKFTAEVPIVLLVLEEYDGLLINAADHDQVTGAKGPDRALPKIKARVRALVAQGAKAGIRVVLITQRMDADTVNGATRGQLGTRLSFRVDNGDALRMLHPEVTPEVVDRVTHFSPGRCLYWQNGEEQVVQADLTEYAEYCGHVDRALSQENEEL